MSRGLKKDKNTQTAIQTFCPSEGKCNLPPGATEHKGESVRCVVDGDLTYNWPSGNTDTLSMIAGDDYAIRENTTVTIDSGIFHIS